MNLEEILVASFPVGFLMVLIWFVLVRKLCARLEQKHPAVYERMGRPTLFVRNSPGSTLAMLMFLFRREHRPLNDPDLSLLSDRMLVFLAIYSVLFTALMVAVTTQAMQFT